MGLGRLVVELGEAIQRHLLKRSLEAVKTLIKDTPDFETPWETLKGREDLNTFGRKYGAFLIKLRAATGVEETEG